MVQWKNISLFIENLSKTSYEKSISVSFLKNQVVLNVYNSAISKSVQSTAM